MTGADETIGVFAINVPMDARRVPFNADNIDAYVDHIVDSCNMALFLLVQAEPPAEHINTLLDRIVSGAISAVMHAAAMTGGPEGVTPLQSPPLLGILAMRSKEACLARLTSIVSELVGEEIPND